MLKDLKKYLKEFAGEKEIEWIIPHPFLPPRYQKRCENRNMILLIDLDFIAHIKWEGARIEDWCSPTPGELRTLLRQVQVKVKKYQKQMVVFSKFVDGAVDEPFGNPIDDDLSSKRKPKNAELIEDDKINLIVDINLGGIDRMKDEALESLAERFFD